MKKRVIFLFCVILFCGHQFWLCICVSPSICLYVVCVHKYIVSYPKEKGHIKTSLNLFPSFVIAICNYNWKRNYVGFYCCLKWPFRNHFEFFWVPISNRSILWRSLLAFSASNVDFWSLSSHRINWPQLSATGPGYLETTSRHGTHFACSDVSFKTGQFC